MVCPRSGRIEGPPWQAQKNALRAGAPVAEKRESQLSGLAGASATSSAPFSLQVAS
jgi:hypothetical protein